MTVSSDLALIESRIADAVDRFMALDADDTIEGPCLTISREVARQALISSEGGKRLRALLALHAFDATGMTTMTPMPADATRCSTWPAR